MTLDVSGYIQRHFYSLGWQVAEHPYFFIAISLTVSVLLMASAKNMPYHADQLYYVAAYNTESRHAEEIHKYFNSLQYQCIPDFSNPNKTLSTGKLMPDRVANSVNILSVIIKPKDGGSIFRKEILGEVEHIHKKILETRAESLGKSWRYEDLCMPMHVHCPEGNKPDEDICNNKNGPSSILSDCMYMDISPILANADKIENQEVLVTWPIVGFEDHLDNLLYGPALLGNANASEAGILQSAAAFRLLYVLNDEDPIISTAIHDWSSAIARVLTDTASSQLRLTDISYITHDSTNDAELELLIVILKAAVIAGMVLVVFASAASITGDWVTSKIWLGVVSVIIVLLGTTSAFSLLGLFGMPFTVYLPIIGILVLGIGLDDSFVILNAWMVTPKRQNVQRRLAEVYAEAGTSIATTSLTNVIGFAIASFIPFRYFFVFGICSSAAIIFVFVYTLTMYGPILALMGRAEEQNRSCLTFKKMDRDGSNDSALESKPAPAQPVHSMAILYAIQNRPWCQWWTNFVCNKFAKFYIGAAYMAYISGAAYFASQSRIAVIAESPMRNSNPVSLYLLDNTEYFLQSPERYEVLIMGHIDYSDPVVQKDLLSLLKRAEAEGYFQEALYTDSWLRAYLGFINVTKEILNLNITGEQNFNYNLKKYFLIGDESSLASDVRFDSQGHIIASRFMLQPKLLDGLTGYYQLMMYMRHLVTSVPYHDAYNITVHATNNVFAGETLYTIKTQLLPSILTTCAVMCCVGFLMIPRKEYAFYVALSLASVEIGILGFLKAFGFDVTLSIFNTLLISFGFSVDSVAHVCFAFSKADCDPSDEKSETCSACQTRKDPSHFSDVKESLLPCMAPSEIRLTRTLKRVMRAIITGASSTVIAVLPIACVGCSAIVPFVWGVVLTMCLSVLHGFVFLPAVLVAANSRSLRQLQASQEKQQETRKNSITFGSLFNVVALEASARALAHRDSSDAILAHRDSLHETKM